MPVEVIDSYCEVILDEGQFCVSESISRETKHELLSNLQNQLTRFADETKYSPEDFQSGKALLIILQKIFGSKEYLQGVKLDEQVHAYYNKTMHMLNSAIEQLPVFSAETTFAIVSNFLLITNNIAAWTSVRKTDHRHNALVEFTTTDRNYHTAFAYLDSVLKIKEKGIKAERRIARKNRDHTKTIGFHMHMKQITKILVTGVLIVTAVSMLIAFIVGQNDVTEKVVRPESDNIFSSIGNWINYDVFGAEMPVVKEEGTLKKASPYTMAVFVVSVLLMISLWIAKPLYKALTVKQEEINNTLDEQAKRTWYEFQYLHKVLIATNMRLNELGE